MKLSDKLLIGATILSIAWALIMAARLPLGLCVAIASPLREEFQAAHSEDESRKLTAELCVTIGNAVRDVVLLSSAPALITSLLWCLLAGARWYRNVSAGRLAPDQGEPTPDRPLKAGRRRPRP
jgi:hypothetical protein